MWSPRAGPASRLQAWEGSSQQQPAARQPVLSFFFSFLRTNAKHRRHAAGLEHDWRHTEKSVQSAAPSAPLFTVHHFFLFALQESPGKERRSGYVSIH